MQNTISVAISGQLALARRMEVVARNIANVNTPGFRAESMKFDTIVSPLAMQDSTKVNFSSAGKGYINTDHGMLIKTDNALDVAVKGDSYLGLETSAGIVYTRDGRMHVTEDGMLVSVLGYPVLDAGGMPLQLIVGNGEPKISDNGNIYQNGVHIGALGLFQFHPDTKLHYGPNSSVIPDREVTAITDDSQHGVMQGFIENSNVNGVFEMTRLIEISRSFERVESMLRQQEEIASKTREVFGTIR